MASSSSPSGGSASNKPEAVSQLPISNTRSHQHEDMQVPTEAIPSPTRSNPWSESSSQTDVPFYSALQTPEDSISVASESFQSLYDEEDEITDETVIREPSPASLSQRTLQIPTSTSETIQITSNPFVRTGDLGLSQEYQVVTEPSSVESEEQLKVQSQLEEEGPSSSKYSTKGKEKSEETQLKHPITFGLDEIVSGIKISGLGSGNDTTPSGHKASKLSTMSLPMSSDNGASKQPKAPEQSKENPSIDDKAKAFLTISGSDNQPSAKGKGKAPMLSTPSAGPSSGEPRQRSVLDINPVDPSRPTLPIIERLRLGERGGSKPRQLSPREQALTGEALNVGPSSVLGAEPSRTPASRPGQTRGSRRSHAIPIVRPGSASRGPTPLQDYAHGIQGVPSHYIPLEGLCHGMFFDPTTNLFIGDGEPRSTVERPDGSLPGTTQAMVDALPRPVHPRGVAEDAFHIQSYDFVGSATAAGNARREAARTQPSSSTSARAPDAPFQRYFCRCTGRWLARRHNCTQGPMQGRPEQSGAGIAPGSTLPRDWITHKIVVDASVNPEGEVPTRAGSSNVVDPGFQPTGTTSSPAVTDTNVGIPPAASRPAYDGGQLQPIPEIQPEESQAPEGEKKKKNKKKKNKNKKAASSDEPTAEESSTTTTTTTTTTTASTTNLAPISEDTPALITTTTTTTNPTSISEDVPTTTTDDKDNGSDSSSSDDAAEATAAAAAAAVASGEGASSGAKAATHGAHEGPKKAKKGGKKSSGKKGGGKKKGGRK